MGRYGKKSGVKAGWGATVVGVDPLVKKLEGLEKKVAKKVLRKALREAARPVLDAARQKVPVDSGALKASLAIRAIRRSRKRVGVVVTTKEGMFKGETFYGGFVEFGTMDQPGQPFLRPALKENRQKSRDIARQIIADGIEREAKS